MHGPVLAACGLLITAVAVVAPGAALTNGKPFAIAAKGHAVADGGSPARLATSHERRLPRQTIADRKLLIIIDPGHGGVDPGAIGPSGTLEKDVVLAFSLTLRDKLEAFEHYRVLLTRSHDTPFGLFWRQSLAQLVSRSTQSPALFLSIHADAVPGWLGRRTRGASVYVHGGMRRQRQAEPSPNDASTPRNGPHPTMAGVDEPEERPEISEQPDASAVFACMVLQALQPHIPLRWTQPRMGKFTVLYGVPSPAILLELGVLTNPDDEQLLTSPKWHDAVAAALVGTIERFFSNFDARGEPC